MKRVGFARICQESNALSPVATELADFETAHYLVGNDLLRATTKGPELEGFFKRAELAGFMQAIGERRREFEPVPLISAWASSGGPLSKACFETLSERLIELVTKAGPLDGLYIALHGAMGVLGIVDPESQLIERLRAVVGSIPLVISHDLHANLTKRRVELVDAIVAYQTNPHRDHARVGKKAGRILLGTIAGEIKPVMAWRSLPILLGGGKTIDFLSPMRAVFRRMGHAEKQRGILSASTFMVHPWNDNPQLGWSTLVVADRDVEAADRIAEELAGMCWERRHEQPPPFPDAKSAIDSARAAKLRRRFGCVTMADASDVVTAGAPGDSTHLLRALLEHGNGMLAFAAVRDPDAVHALWARAPGDVVVTTIGGKLDPSRSKPLPVRGTIQSKHDRPGFGKTIVLAIDHVRVVVTEGPAMVMRPSFYTDVGLDVWKADIVMVKNFFPFLMFFLRYNRKTLFVRTHGTTDFDAAFQLEFDGPIHPRDRVDDWRERDAKRRGIADEPLRRQA
ncbi:MAG: M81 family metallopeptidase [Kofleriaceae bacterium]